jgi:hypothetical protein
MADRLQSFLVKADAAAKLTAAVHCIFSQDFGHPLIATNSAPRDYQTATSHGPPKLRMLSWLHC